MAQSNESMLPPPESIHSSFDEALNYCQTWAKEHGYALSKSSTKKLYKGGPYITAFLQCDRGETYKSTAQVRKSSTRATGCPFKCQIRLIKHESHYQFITHNPTHNHPPSWSATAHPIHRRIDEYTRNIIQAETRAGVKPKQILARLAQEIPASAVRQKDVYNAVSKIRKDTLQGMTPIEALVTQLGDPNLWISDHRTDSSGRLTHLFFAYIKTVKIFQSHPDVLMADCTYRTNRFKMPLLHFVGCNSIGGHFTAAFCFLPSETHQDYVWALDRVRQLLYEPVHCSPVIFLSDNESAVRSACAEIWPDVPQLLCLWHVNKNVQDHLQKHFRRANGPFTLTDIEKRAQQKKRDAFMSSWALLNFSKTEARYEEQWAAFKREYHEYPVMLRYLEESQYPQRKRVAAPWTSQYRHYGNITTSKLESAHYQAKSSLLHNQGHLLDVVQKLENYWNTHFREYEAKLASQFIKFPPNIDAKNIEEWDSCLNEFITPFALQLCREQLNKARENTMSARCTGKFTQIWGIPCCHDLRAWRAVSRPVKPADFDAHWLWERQGTNNVFQRAAVESQIRIPTIFDPQIAPARGPQRRNDRSTRRDLSQFELSDPDRSSRSLSRTPSRTSSQTPSIIASCEPIPPSGYINLPFLEGRSPTPMTGSQPSSCRSIPAPTVDWGAGTPAQLSQRQSPAIGASISGPRRITEGSMEPLPPKRAKHSPCVTKAAKEEAMHRIVLAWSKIGQPPSVQQLQAMNTHWSPLMDTLAVAGRLVTQLIFIGHPATSQQVEALEQALRSGPPLLRPPT